jgi:hypothetical protein
MTKPRISKEYIDDCRLFIDFAILNCRTPDGLIFCLCKMMYKFNCTRQLHESIVVMWLCKCECRTHRESALSKTNFKVPKLIKSQPSSDFKHVVCIK